MRAFNKKHKPKHHTKPRWNLWNSCFYCKDMSQPQIVINFGKEYYVQVMREEILLVEKKEV